MKETHHQSWVQENPPTHTEFFNQAVVDPELHEGLTLGWEDTPQKSPGDTNPLQQVLTYYN